MIRAEQQRDQPPLLQRVIILLAHCTDRIERLVIYHSRSHCGDRKGWPELVLSGHDMCTCLIRPCITYMQYYTACIIDHVLVSGKLCRVRPIRVHRDALVLCCLSSQSYHTSLASLRATGDLTAGVSSIGYSSACTHMCPSAMHLHRPLYRKDQPQASATSSMTFVLTCLLVLELRDLEGLRHGLRKVHTCKPFTSQMMISSKNTENVILAAAAC